jgi:hypothetical protein
VGRLTEQSGDVEPRYLPLLLNATLLPHHGISLWQAQSRRVNSPLILDAQERAYYDRLFAVIDKEDVGRNTCPKADWQSGVLPGQDALPFLVSSGLPQQLLGEVWALADPDNNGFLTRDGWYKAARLIGWLQNGKQTTVDEGLLSKRTHFVGPN